VVVTGANECLESNQEMRVAYRSSARRMSTAGVDASWSWDVPSGRCSRAGVAQVGGRPRRSWGGRPAEWSAVLDCGDFEPQDDLDGVSGYSVVGEAASNGSLRRSLAEVPFIQCRKRRRSSVRTTPRQRYNDMARQLHIEPDENA